MRPYVANQFNNYGIWCIEAFWEQLPYEVTDLIVASGKNTNLWCVLTFIIKISSKQNLLPIKALMLTEFNLYKEKTTTY